MSLVHEVPYAGTMRDVLAVLDEVQCRKRGPRPEEYHESFIPDYYGVGDILNAQAEVYAEEVLKARADLQSPMIVNEYMPGHLCPNHIDQYDEGSMNRTASCSLIVDKAEAGGEMVLQDPGKTETYTVNPKSGTVIFFPADWWHRVAPIKRGMRRSLIRWWSDSTIKSFSSKDFVDEYRA